MKCTLALLALATALGAGPAAAQKINLNVVTAGDQNMVDYVKDYLGPMFEKKNPGVRVTAVGTGPGDAGSQKIYEKLAAQQQAGAEQGDVDVAVIHQKMAGDLVREGLLAPYVRDVSTGRLVTSEASKNALGVSTDTALRLAKYFGTSPNVWLNLQQAYDLAVGADQIKDDLAAMKDCERLAEDASD